MIHNRNIWNSACFAASLFLLGCLSVEPLSSVDLQQDNDSGTHDLAAETVAPADSMDETGGPGIDIVPEINEVSDQADETDDIVEQDLDVVDLGSDEICTPNCEGKECGDDDCGGVCGADDGTCQEHYQCKDGQCVYVSWCGDGNVDDGETCLTCFEDVCESDQEVCSSLTGECCQPGCVDVECGPDGCGGACGECPDGTPYCQEGQCFDICIPDCTDKECGFSCDVPCNGYDGVCQGENQVCQNHQCVCEFKPCGEEPYTACCQDGQVCFENQCCTPQTCDALGYECGDYVSDTCGGVIESCGPCPESYLCEEGQCVYNPNCPNGTCDPDEDCANCAADCGCGCGEECQNGTCKFTACDGKQCGKITPDGCSSPIDCGSCPAENYYYVQCEEYQCEYSPIALDGECLPVENCTTSPDDCACGCGEACAEGTCVSQTCEQLELSAQCGEVNLDCGTTVYCGGCPDNQACIDNECKAVTWCGDETCQSEENCSTCGDDCACTGCGETCVSGTCEFTACTDAAWMCGDDPEGCGQSCGECTLDDQVCHNGTCCTPNCEGKECGDDGCGGYCNENLNGLCGPNAGCVQGQCNCLYAGYTECGLTCCAPTEECNTSTGVCEPL